MKTLLILAMFLVSQPLSQVQSQPQPKQARMTQEFQKVLKQIKKNNPRIPKDYSQKLAQTILTKSKKHGVSAKVMAAMLMQESSYAINAKNTRCGVSITTGERDCVVVDYGIGQINHKTIKHFKFDEKKLLSDLEYSVEAAAIVLADFKRMYGHKEHEYWTRYNASTPSKRQIYKSLVARYM